MRAKKTSGTPVKVRKRRWTKDDLATLSISLVPIPSPCCFATQYFTTLYLLLSVLQWQ